MKVPFLDLHACYEELKTPIDEAVGRVLASGWYILGDEVTGFEDAFAAYCGVPHCVGTGNGYDALTLALRALDVGPGDEVIVPANTYIATWLAVSAVGATCVPVEPEEHGANINLDLVEEAITDQTKVLLPVHLYGHPVDMERVDKLANSHGLRVVQDCAQAHGTTWRGKPVACYGDLAAFSFYPTKNLGAVGDAGAVVTADRGLAERVRLLGNYGSAQKYHNDIIGFNSRLDPVQAAVLATKLIHLDDWNCRRTSQANRYLDALSSMPHINPVVPPADGESAWHVFAVETIRRDELLAHLENDGIGTLIHYPVPPHQSAAYQSAGYVGVSLPVTERKAQQLVSLPIGPHLVAEQIGYVIQSLRAFDR